MRRRERRARKFSARNSRSLQVKADVHAKVDNKVATQVKAKAQVKVWCEKHVGKEVSLIGCPNDVQLTNRMQNPGKISDVQLEKRPDDNSWLTMIKTEVSEFFSNLWETV